jgi:hypothetical protein
MSELHNDTGMVISSVNFPFLQFILAAGEAGKPSGSN